MSEGRGDRSRGHRSSNANERSLPPIREVFADELMDLPARPSPYSFEAVHSALPRPETTRSSSSWYHSRDSGTNEQHRGGSYGLPPTQQPSGVQQSHSGTAGERRDSHPRSSSVQHDSQPGRRSSHRNEELGHSYSVLRTSGSSGGLVNATPPSGRPQGILRQTAAPAHDSHEDPSKRYMCEYCGKRFGMPSHLQIHLRTHTAQRPYACEWPNCDRTFSVRSNMMRHFRSHGGYGQQSSEHSRYDGDDNLPKRSEVPLSSSRHARDRSSSSHQYPSSSQYYESRRK